MITMTMMIAIIFGSIVAGVTLDLIWNGGDGIVSIISAFKSKAVAKTACDTRIQLVEKLSDELDSLLSDMEYEMDESEQRSLEQKISTLGLSH